MVSYIIIRQKSSFSSVKNILGNIMEEIFALILWQKKHACK